MSEPRSEPRFLVFDTETVVDGRLVQRVRFPDEPRLSPREAVLRFQQELMEKDGRDFVPSPYHVPISLAVVSVGKGHELIDLVTLDRPAFRPQVITRLFWDGWRRRRYPTLVSFNGRGFDVPVLEQAAFRYGISLEGWLKLDAKPRDDPRNRYSSHAHLDLQQVIGNFGAGRVDGGLNLLAQLVGKPGKMRVSGKDVQDLWEDGKLMRIDDYCACDALDTYFVFLRLQTLMGELTLEREGELVHRAHEIVERKAESLPALSDYLRAFRFWKPPSDDGWPFLDPGDASRA